jgi:GT2 family glycosyltransferase
MSEAIRVVSATRKSAEEFEADTALGRSLTLLRPITPVETEVAFNNSQGLSAVYNQAIARAKDEPAILVFVHDDVYIADVLWVDETRRCLTAFAVVGLAGNVRRLPGQPNWAFVVGPDGTPGWDERDNLSGVVGHGDPPGTLAVFGRVHQECKLLDGVFLAARSTTLLERGVRFDPQFDFHFYDMDFCRQAELKGLRMGTASIKVVHRSDGKFASPEWVAAYERYLAKYGS